MAWKGAAVVGLNYVLGKIPTKIDITKLRYADKFTINGDVWHTYRTAKTATVRDLIWNAMAVAEEQLFKMPRAFSASSIYGARVYSNLAINLKPEWLTKQGDYLKQISGGKITNAHLQSGRMRFQNGKLLYQNQSGIDDILLKYAKVVPGKTGPGNRMSRFTKALYEQYNLHIPDSDFVITGGTSKLRAFGETASAWTTVATQNYMRLLDNPMELFGNLSKTKWYRALEADQGLGGRTFKKVGSLYNKYFRDQLGVGGANYLRGNTARLWKRHITHGFPKIIAGIAAWKISNAVLKSVLGTDAKGIAAQAYQDVTKLYSHVSEKTGLTALNKYQEEKAPGTHKFTGLLAVLLTGAIAGGTIAGLSNVGRAPLNGKMAAPKWFFDFAYKAESLGGISGKAARLANLTGKGRVGAFAMTGAAIGAAVITPFLLGSLGSNKTPEELNKIYHGEEWIPVRRGRFWTMGNTPFEGGEIDYYQPHWTVRAKTDAREKGIMPEEYYNKPVKRFIKRLFDPYYMERALDEERPYAYWGPTDYGAGLPEKLFSPLKQVLKPTVLAHPETAGKLHPAQEPQITADIPESINGIDAISTKGIYPTITSPSTVQGYASELGKSLTDTFGLQGFALRSVKDTMASGQSFIIPSMRYESSGRIMSAQRSYWDQNVGDLAGLNEWYRRLNPDRDYDTEYVHAAIRNKMPEWIGREDLKYGDPFSIIENGELRLPGRGYETLYPYLSGLNPDDYPAVHKMQILSDVAPYSAEYHMFRNAVESQIINNQLNQAGVNLYQETLRREEEVKNDTRFDTGSGPLGAYWLAVKKAGRMLPTESLYPIAPMHKFSGPVDPMTEYKSMVLLDKSFKSWEHPYKDFIKPAINKTMNILTFGNFIPKETAENAELDSYFSAMQFAKNRLLEEKANVASEQGEFEAAAYYRSGKRAALEGSNPLANISNAIGLLPKREQRFFAAFAGETETDKRSQILQTINPQTAQVLNAHWAHSDAMTMHDLDVAKQLESNMAPVQTTTEPVVLGNNVPDRNFIGYAPDVNLNAFKVKVANNLGKNIRDFDLWRQDERQAQILDATTDLYGDMPTPVPSSSSITSKNDIQNYLTNLGMHDARIISTPIRGSSVIDFQGKQNNKKDIREKMRDMGLFHY